MSRFEQDEAVRALGEALATLRHERGLSQAEAGAAIGMTSQGWGLYEAGKRPGLFRPDLQRRLTGALGLSPEDLALAAARVAGIVPREARSGVASNGRSFDPATQVSSPPKRERLQLSSDELTPWATSGVVIEFDPGRWPRRDQGCVIDLRDGRRLIRLYDRADTERLYLRGGPKGLSTEVSIDRGDIARVAAVTARIDE